MSVGNHTITLNVTDDAGNIGTDSINITITNETKPDVSIHNITFYPENLTEGEDNYIIATVYNIIQDALINILFYNGNPATNGTLIDNYYTYAYANYLTDLYGSLKSLSAGNYTIFVKIANATPEESNISNNQANATVEILSAVPKIGLDLISPSGDINVTKNGFFNVVLNVSCLNNNCEEINTSLWVNYSYQTGYGLSSGYELVSTNTAETPFYTNKTSNPFNITLNKNENQEVIFWINATGNVNKTWEFYSSANLTSDMNIGNETLMWNVTVIS